MNRNDLLNSMKQSIGSQEPIVFFDKMVDALNLLFNRIDDLESQIKDANLKVALAIHWEPKLASSLLSKMIDRMRKEDKETYAEQIVQLKKAFVDDKITHSYLSFCQFWEEVLGYHAFMSYED